MTTPAVSDEERALNRAAHAKRRDEAFVRLAADLGLFVPGRLILELAHIHADPRPILGGWSSFDVAVHLQLAMLRDGLFTMAPTGCQR